MSFIRISGVVKRFGSIVAVNGVDLDIEAGECFGLLGPNGAGKTSLVRMIIAASPITEGRIWVDGKDIVKSPRAIKATLGVVPQLDNLDPDLNVLENLVTFARYFDLPGTEARKRALASLQLFELHERQNSKIDTLSGGMKRRLLIARALINQPKLLVLDEPTVGLDPQAKHLVWRKLAALKNQGVTQLLSTQNMEEASYLCDRLAVMNEGKIVALGAPDDLVARYGGHQIVEARLRSEDQRSNVLTMLREHELEWQEIEDTLYIFQGDGQVLKPDLSQYLAIRNQHAPTLEDVFLRLTGRALRE